LEFTPTSTIYSPLLTDIEKFGTPGTRHSILTEAQTNIIWEASDIDDDDDGGTSMASGIATPMSSYTATTSKSTKVTPIRPTSLNQNYDDLENENIQPDDQNSPNHDYIHPNKDIESLNEVSPISTIVVPIDTPGRHRLNTCSTLLSSNTVDDNDNDNVHHILTNASNKFNQITLCKSDNDQVDQKYVNNHLGQMNVMKRIQHFDTLSAKRPSSLKLSLSSSSLPSSTSSSTMTHSPAVNHIHPSLDTAPHSINRGLPELRHTRSINRDM